MSNKGSNISLNKATNKVSNYLKGSNSIVMLLVGIFAFIVVGLIVYWVYQAISRTYKGDSENPILVPGVIDPTKSKNAKKWSLPISSSNNSPSLSFTLTYWMYVSNWNYRLGEIKTILFKGNPYSPDSVDAAPFISLDANQNKLIVITRINTPEMFNQCNIDNIPLQKWVHVAYVLNNRVVDVYINGKLERSCVLSGVPILNSEDLYLFPTNFKSISSDHGYMGQFSSLRYFSSSLRPVDIARLYNEGPYSTEGATGKDHSGTHGKNGDDDGDSCPPTNYVANFDMSKMKKEISQYF